MSNKQARLVYAVQKAMQAQGFSQNNLARVSGVAQSMISAAILGKYDLKEEKWRLLCEALALDYDAIIEEPVPEEQFEAPALVTEETEPITKEIEPVTEETDPVTKEPAAQVQQEAPICCENAAENSGGAEPARLVMVLDKPQARIIAEYMAAKLRDDLCKGTLMPLEDLYTLLSHVKQLQGTIEEE